MSIWRHLAVAWLCVLSWSASAQIPVHHDLQVELLPERHALIARDEITLPDPPARDTELMISLHRALKPRVLTPGVQLSSAPGAVPSGQSMARYRLIVPGGTRTVVIDYRGEIHHPPGRGGPAEDTPGTISPQGIYLAHSSGWYAQIEDSLVTFSLEVRLPAGWEAVSQGVRARHERGPGGTTVRWDEPRPQEEIYLVGGRYHEYVSVAPPHEGMVFLLREDEALATKYLDATHRYLKMYAQMLGPYPYKKFALVENFWETGYGMPSFTLLGPTVVRLPFIINSSYPHEILHNWWGNGVYVDPALGNWSEGLTAYLSDHLLQEQSGTGAEARRATLQRYADHVHSGRDFPLTDFRSRHSESTEAVGYGKTLMFFHMLRRRLGDEAFTAGLREFYRVKRFQRAHWEDLRHALAAQTKTDLRGEFGQWLTRTGAPALKLTDIQVIAEGGGYVFSAVLEQTQPEPVFALSVPLAITVDGQEQAHETEVASTGRRTPVRLRLERRPLRVDVDPQYDVFRRLDPGEVPPALSLAFGDERILVLLPATAPEALRESYRKLAQSWAAGVAGRLDIKLDTELTTLPGDRTVWLLGWENRFLPELRVALRPYAAELTERGAQLGGTRLARRGDAVALVVRQSASSHALAWLATDNVAAIPGLARKLPHYGKYSYVGFTGDEPRNTTKGAWPVVDSPLSLMLPDAQGKRLPVQPARLQPRQPLVQLPAPAPSGGSAFAGLEGQGSTRPGGRHAGEKKAEPARPAM